MGIPRAGDGTGLSGSRKALTVDFAGLFASLRSAPPSDTPGTYTTQEVMQLTGMAEGAARSSIKAALAAGLAEVTQKRTRAMDGRMALVPAYKFVSEG